IRTSLTRHAQECRLPCYCFFDNPAPASPSDVPLHDALPIYLAVRQEAGGLAIEFLLSGPVTPRLSRLDSPARVVVDLPKTVAVKIQSGHALAPVSVEDVRVGLD